MKMSELGFIRLKDFRIDYNNPEIQISNKSQFRQKNK